MCIRDRPVVLLILAVGLILLTMQLNISELVWAYSKKLALFWLVFGPVSYTHLDVYKRQVFRFGHDVHFLHATAVDEVIDVATAPGCAQRGIDVADRNAQRLRCV